MSNQYNTTDYYPTPPWPRLTKQGQDRRSYSPWALGKEPCGNTAGGFLGPATDSPPLVFGLPSGRDAALLTGGKMAAILQLSQYCTFRTDSISTVITEPGQPVSHRAAGILSGRTPSDGSPGTEALKDPLLEGGEAEGKTGSQPSNWWGWNSKRAGWIIVRRMMNICFIHINDEPTRIHQTSFLALFDNVASTEQGFTDSIFLTSIIHAVNIYWRSTVFQDIFWMSRNWR